MIPVTRIRGIWSIELRYIEVEANLIILRKSLKVNPEILDFLSEL